MKQLLIIIMVSFLIKCSGQTFTDKQLIYSAIIDSFVDKQVPIINQTVTGFAEYDIDGDYERWLYKRKDSSLKGWNICGNPIKYSQSVTKFISSNGFDSSGIFLYIQTGRKGLDSLTNYTSSRKFIDCKYRPTPNSYFWNLFYKKRKAAAFMGGKTNY